MRHSLHQSSAAVSFRATRTTPRWLAQTVWTALLLAAIALLFVRGPWRALQQSGDFAPAYLSTRLWLQAGNPYAHERFPALWQAAGGTPGQAPTLATTPSVYPPTAFVLLAPLAWLPWNAARLALLGLNVALVLAAIRALAHAAELGAWQRRAFWIAALAFAPLHSGLATGNLIILAGSCALLAVWAGLRNREGMAAALLAVAFCLKPHVGGVFWLVYLLRGQWKVIALAAGLTLVVALLALAPLAARQTPWLDGLLASNAAAVAPGGVNDPTAANPSRHHLLNLQRLLFTFLAPPWLVNAIAVSVSAFLFVVWLRAHRRPTSGPQELLRVGALATISLLPVYHRFYDAFILLLPLAWALAVWRGARPTSARLALLCLAPLFAPGAALLHEALRVGRMPAQWATTWWWNAVLMSHQVWAVLLLACVLTYALTRSPTTGASEP